MTTSNGWSVARRSWRASAPSCSAGRTACGAAELAPPLPRRSAHASAGSRLGAAGHRLMCQGLPDPGHQATAGRQHACRQGQQPCCARKPALQTAAAPRSPGCSDELAAARSDHQRAREELLGQESSVEKRAAIGAGRRLRRLATAARVWAVVPRPVCLPHAGPPAVSPSFASSPAAAKLEAYSSRFHSQSLLCVVSPAAPPTLSTCLAARAEAQMRELEQLNVSLQQQVRLSYLLVVCLNAASTSPQCCAELARRHALLAAFLAARRSTGAAVGLLCCPFHHCQP